MVSKIINTNVNNHVPLLANINVAAYVDVLHVFLMDILLENM